METVKQAMDHHPISELFWWGSAGQKMAHQSESGDDCTFCQFPGGALAAVVDGLGHGQGAAVAAKTAIAVLESNADQPLATLVEQCHTALRKTRGAVLSLASFNRLPDKAPLSSENGWRMTWIGVGNIKGVLVRPCPPASAKREWLVARGGVVGYNLPTSRPADLPLIAGDTLILATDGIQSNFTEKLDVTSFRYQDNPAQAIAEHILARSMRGTDDALVLVVQYR